MKGQTYRQLARRSRRVKLMGLLLALMLVGFGATSPASAGSMSATRLDTGTNVIIVHAQDTNTGQIIVDSVTAAQDGWLLIRKDANGAPGDMIGFAPVHKGTTTYVRVDIQPVDFYGNDNITPTLWATLVADPYALIPFAVPSSIVLHEDSAAIAAFSSSAAGGAAPVVAAATGKVSSSSAAGANRIIVRAQTTNSGQVIVDSVTAAQDGWLLIRKDANGRPGDVLGFAPVNQGLNTAVIVDIRTTNAKGDNIVTPVLWATLVADPYALDPFAMPNAAVEQESSLVMVAFSTR
jgi:hypothetical protein